jgi:osmotically inducible lipoprotein OsmE
MNKPLCALVVAVAATGGCSTESRLYGDQPLVANVETGMSLDQVRQIGGQPQSISQRTVVPGTCFDYTLKKDSRRHAYNVSFDDKGKVDHTSFLTCAEWSNAQQKARETSHSGGGGGGY